MAKIVKEAFRKPFSVAAQSGGSASADAAAVPLVDGRADDHTEKIRQASRAAGIYGMILCKTENFPGGSGTFRTCAFRQYRTGSAGLKDGFSVCHMDRPLKKTIKKKRPAKAIPAPRYNMGIMTNARNVPVRKSCGILI